MTGRASTSSGMVALGSGIVTYVGPGAIADAHRHDAIQVIWSPDPTNAARYRQRIDQLNPAVIPFRTTSPPVGLVH